MSAINLLRLVKSSNILRDSIKDVREMHKECVEMFELAWEVYKGTNDREKAHLVAGKEARVDALEVKVRHKVLNYLAGMPSGGNVPLSLILIDTSTDLERIADHIWYYSDDAVKYPRLKDKKFAPLLEEMRKLSYEMLTSVETVLGACDEKTAQRVVGMNKDLQSVYNKIIDDLHDTKMDMEHALGIVLTARNLRRVGKKSASIMKYCLKPYPEAGA